LKGIFVSVGETITRALVTDITTKAAGALENVILGRKGKEGDTGGLLGTVFGVFGGHKSAPAGASGGGAYPADFVGPIPPSATDMRSAAGAGLSPDAAKASGGIGGVAGAMGLVNMGLGIANQAVDFYNKTFGKI